MGVILFIFIIVMMFRLSALQRMKNESKPKTEISELDKPIAIKKCPPHKWYHHEIKDTSGETVGWRMVCKDCGPMQPIN